MGELKKVGKIQVEEDLQFLKREWRVQRIGWIIMGLIFAAAAVGALGGGPVAQARYGDPHVFEIDLPRLSRHGAIEDMRISVGPGFQSDSAVRIAITSAYLDAFKIEDIKPQPAEQLAAGEFIIFAFPRVDARQPLHVSFKLRPEDYGSVQGRVQLMGGSTIDVRQFILP